MPNAKKPYSLFLYALFYLFCYFFLSEINDGYARVGTASWYGGEDHGRRTDSGGNFDPNDRTAAHRRLPFGTMVKITRLSNGKETVVRINDRGPSIPGRIIDISKAAAQDLGIERKGVADVRIQVLSYPKK